MIRIRKYGLLYFFFAGSVLLCLTSCDTRAEGSTNSLDPEEKTERIAIEEPEKALPGEEEEKERRWHSYRIDSLSTAAELDTFNNKYSEDQRKIIYALNRVDPHRVRPGSVLVVPDSLVPDLMEYSPFPRSLEVLDSIPKSILISQRIQAFALYENQRLVRWGPVSSGKQTTPTPNGLFYSNYRAKRKISTVNESWIMPYYINFMNFRGVGSHQYTLPGFPASHACVRLYMEDAKFIYDWADMWILEKDIVVKNGTPFMVFGDYDFEAPYPWKKLVEDPDSNNLDDEELEIIRSYVKEFKKDSRNFREVELRQVPEEFLGM